MKTGIAAFAALVALAPPARADGTAHKSSPKHEEASLIKSDEIKWGEAPPSLPKGGMIAVLYGDPSKSAPFAIRLKAPAGYRIPPHWHSQDEQLTIISGTLLMRMGDTMDSEPHALDAGSFHYLPGKMHHSAEANGETVVQINGKGPFDIHYLNPADDPTKMSAEAKDEPKTGQKGRAAGRRP